MRTAVAVAALVSIIAVGSVRAADRDGNWWARQDERNRLAYLIGYIDGTGYSIMILDEAQYEAWFDPKTKKPDSKRAAAARDVVDATIARVDRNLARITAGQLNDGVTKLYEDYRNRNLAVADCIELVVAAIAGSSDETIARLLEAKRKQANR